MSGEELFMNVILMLICYAFSSASIGRWTIINADKPIKSVEREIRKSLESGKFLFSTAYA